MSTATLPDDKLKELFEKVRTSSELELHTRIEDPVAKDDRFYVAKCIDKIGFVVIDTETMNMCLTDEPDEAIRRAPR